MSPQSARAGNLMWGGLLFGGGQVLALAVGFLGNVLLVRVATQSTVGSYLLVLRAMAALAIVLQVGLVPAVLRFAPLCRGIGGERMMPLLRRQLFTVQLALWIAASPAVLLLWPKLIELTGNPQLASAGPLVVLTGIAISFSAVADAYIRSARLYGTSAALSQLFVRTGVVVVLAAALAGGHVVSWKFLAWSFATLQCLAALCFVWALRRGRHTDSVGDRQASRPPGTRDLLSVIGVMGLRNSLAAMMVSWDLWILAWARPDQEVAVYGVMLSLLQVIAILPLAANMVIPQELAVLHEQGRRAELESLVRTSATIVASIAILSVVVLALAGKPVIRVAFGPEYVQGWAILLILAVGRLWDAACGAAGFVLQMTGHHLILLKLTVTAAVLNIITALFLAPRWGGLGLAVAATATLIGINVALVVLARRTSRVRTFAFFRPSDLRNVVRRLVAGRAS